MKENLSRCFRLVFDIEKGFVNHPNDPGGPTNLGVTLATLSAWRRRPCTIEDVRALQQPEAMDIFREQYASKVAFDALPPGLDYAVLDCAINSGPDRAARILQSIVGFKGGAVDGIIGQVTLAAVERLPTLELIHAYGETRMAFLRKLTTWGTFGKGWTSRVRRVEFDAVQMAGDMPMFAQPLLFAGAQAKGTGAVKLLATLSGKVSVATLGTTLVTAGATATQVSGFLAPYADIAPVRYLLVILATISAASTVWVAATRTENGATT